MAEQIIEYQVTQWEGVRVRVQIESPHKKNTVTSQLIIDRLDIEELKGLNEPEGFEFMDEYQRMLAMGKWEVERKKAMNIVDMIASQIANQLTRSLAENPEE